MFAWWLLRRRRERAGGCAKCGYRACGLETFRCPGCGSDLREVGIVSPRAGTSVWGAALIALVLTVPLTIFAFGLIVLVFRTLRP